MKLASIKVDADIIDHGAWVENIPGMDDLRLKVRPLGNPDYRRRMGELAAKVPRAKRKDQAEDDRLQAILFSETILIDWENLDQPYSKGAALEIMLDPTMRAFLNAVLWAAGEVTDQRKDDVADAVKN